MLTPVPFYFLRHGETDWNHQRIIQGQTDTPLNALGAQQAEAVAPHVVALPIATICTSSLARAKRTGAIVNRALQKPIVAFDDLRECHLGKIQGEPSNGAWRAAWVNGGPMPGGETFAEYTARVIRGFNQALAQPGPVLIVAHGGNFWALEHHGLIAPGVRVPNCALFRLDPPNGGKLWNVTALYAPAGEALAIGEAPSL
jgi:probable phosphoglycerate mutase